MKHSISKIFLISILWFSILMIGVLFPDSIGSPDYNGYYVVFSGIVCFVLYPNSSIAVIAFLIFAVLLFISTDTIHPIGDASKIIMILCSIQIASKSHYSKYELKILFVLLLIFVISDLLGMLFPVFYKNEGTDDIRYAGLLRSSNISSTIFALSQIALFELKKKSKQEKKYLYANVIILLIMFFASRTRSLLFFFPYWILMLQKNIKKKYFYICGIFVIIVIAINISKILSAVRFEDLDHEGSFKTRLDLYIALIEGLLESWFIIPHGSNSANLLSKKITLDDGFAPHNDLLLYWYDWGIIFFFLIIYTYNQLKINTNINLGYFCIVLAWSSAGLHNFLLLPSSFFLFIISTNLYFHNSIIAKYKFNLSK